MSTATQPFDAKAIPTTEQLETAGELDILDLNGGKLKFKSVFESQKTAVVFIRHFFCGSCLSYVQNLARVSQTSLEAAGTRIVVIGCGEAEFIKKYKETSGFQGDVYADPSRAVFRAMGMTLENLKLNPPEEKRASYLKDESIVTIVLAGMKRAFGAPGLIGKQGNIFQLGGEFVLGPGNQCTFVSRMEHTMQHASVEELMKEAGVDYKESVPA